MTRWSMAAAGSWRERRELCTLEEGCGQDGLTQ